MVILVCVPASVIYLSRFLIKLLLLLGCRLLGSRDFVDIAEVYVMLEMNRVTLRPG